MRQWTREKATRHSVVMSVYKDPSHELQNELLSGESLVKTWSIGIKGYGNKVELNADKSVRDIEGIHACSPPPFSPSCVASAIPHIICSLRAWQSFCLLNKSSPSELYSSFGKASGDLQEEIAKLKSCMYRCFYRRRYVTLSISFLLTLTCTYLVLEQKVDEQAALTKEITSVSFI